MYKKLSICGSKLTEKEDILRCFGLGDNLIMKFYFELIWGWLGVELRE